jgi:hypothetical protein
VRYVWLFLVVAGCFGPHVPHGHYDADARRVCAGDVCYRFGQLPGWRVVRQKGPEIAFFDDRTKAVAQANATCRDDAEAASLEVLMRHLILGYTDVQERKSENVWLDGREALHQIVDARLDGVPIRLDLYVLKRNGCIFDLTLAAPPDQYDAVASNFTRFVSGFAQEKRT